MENQKISEYGLASIVYKSIKQYEEDWKCIVQQKDSEIENLKKTIKDLTTELEEYRSIAENVGAAKAVSEKEKLEKIIKDTLEELPENFIADHILENLSENARYWIRSYAEEREKRVELEKIINDTLRALPVGNINTHTPESIPERVQDWVKEAAEECRLREQWEACADMLFVWADELKCGTTNQAIYEAVCEDIREYNNLKKEFTKN